MKIVLLLIAFGVGAVYVSAQEVYRIVHDEITQVKVILD